MPGAKCDLLRHSISHRLLQWRAEGLTVSMILLTLWDEPGSSLSSTAVRLSQESKHDVPPSSNTRCCSNLSVTPVICTDIYFWLGRRSDQWGLSWHMPLPIVAVSQALWGHRTGRADFCRDVKGEWKSVCCRVAFHQDMPEAKRQVKNPVAVRGAGWLSESNSMSILEKGFHHLWTFDVTDMNWSLPDIWHVTAAGDAFVASFVCLWIYQSAHLA